MCVIAMTTTPPPQGLLSPSMKMGYWPCPWTMATLDSLGTGWPSYRGETDRCVCVHKAVVYFK